MARFYVEENNCLADMITITGSDVNHIKNVLRLRQGDEITICDGVGKEYTCLIDTITGDYVTAKVVDVNANAAELPCKITLFQGMPKSDKLELIIQKSVELGVYEVVPVITSRTIVKVDEKKKDRKLDRYNLIAESAAKQSGRGIIPQVSAFSSWKNALQYAKEFDYILIPYENAEGMEYARGIIKEAANLPAGSRIGIFIGPEGGFAQSEVDDVLSIGGKCISLGNRILRTETAGLATIAILAFEMDR